MASLAALSTAVHAEPGPAPQSADEAMEITVEGKRIRPEQGISRVEVYDQQDIERSDAFTAEELVAKLPPSPPGKRSVVLIDGRETPFDLSNIPVEMIRRLEVNLDGEMPEGGPRADGYVINIIMHENYQGAGINLRQDGSFAGGGGGTQLVGNGSYKRGPLHLTFVATHHGRNALRASDREFSAEQDRTAMGGRDFRLAWGDPPSVQALDGFLNGLTDASGQPVSTALVPQLLPPGGLAPADFIAGPAGQTSAAGLRRFNTADYLYLNSPSDSNSMSLQMRLPLPGRSSLQGAYTYSWSTNEQMSPPPVTAASDQFVVPAAYNPFGQDIAVGMVHTGFGPVDGRSRSGTHTAMLVGEGRLGQMWRWNTQFTYNHSDRDSRTRELDVTKFAAALAAADPDQRFDPFSPARQDYSGLIRWRGSDSASRNGSARLSLQGAVSEGWVEPLFLRTSLAYSFADSDVTETSGVLASFQDSLSQTWRGDANLEIPLFRVGEYTRPTNLTLGTRWTRKSYRADDMAEQTLSARSAEVSLNMPMIAPESEKRWARQLNTQLALGRAGQSGSDSSRTHRLSVFWSPVEPLSVRLNLSEHQPGAMMLGSGGGFGGGRGGFGRRGRMSDFLWLPGFEQRTINYNVTLFDRHRNDPTATNVTVTGDPSVAFGLGISETKSLDLQFQPQWLEDLTLSLTYAVHTQRDQVRYLSAQDVVDNEAVLPGRVTRLPPSESDIAAGQPGPIVSVDVTPLNAGKHQTRSLSFGARFRGPDLGFGSLHFNANARRILDSVNELLPGVPFVTSSQQGSPPDWSFSAEADYRRGPWTARAGVSYNGVGVYAGVPYDSFTTINVGGGYSFQEPFLGKFGRRLRVGFEIGNLLDEEPPRVDTVTGFHGGSALGRTWQLTLRLPLGSAANEEGGFGRRRGGGGMGGGRRRR